jgi:uncharacterized protein YdaU (DUF1376 family)
MSAFPSLPLFTDAYIADTAHLTNEEHGAYLRLLMFAWRSPLCRLPDDDTRLARMLGLSAGKWAKLKVAVMAFWSLENGFWSQKRLAKEHEFVTKKVEQKRANGKQGGRPKSLENNDQGKANGSEHETETKAPTPTPTPTYSSLSENGVSDEAAEGGESEGSDLLGEPIAAADEASTKRKRATYPEAFSALWDAFPTDKNMSKQEAFKAWQKLDADDRAALLASVGPFKAWVATQRDYRVIHLERFIKYRRFDGFAPSTADKAKPAGSDLVAGIHPDRWRNEIRNWQNRGGHWPLGRLTPPPDHPDTKVPRAILAEFGLPARSVLAA